MYMYMRDSDLEGVPALVRDSDLNEAARRRALCVNHEF